MKLRTFYKIYYEHRLNKGSFFLKVYIIITLPFNYLLNKFFLQKIINLDFYSIRNENLYNENFKNLIEYFNSDKATNYINQYNKPLKKAKAFEKGHSYHTFYEKIFSRKKKKIFNILELGSFKGNATAAFFFYFPNAKIISTDLFPDLFRYKSSRIKNIYLDNGKEKQLEEKILKKKLRFDIIIEDAGHYLKDQIISLFMLFETLSSGGYYIVEELEFPNVRKDMNIENEKPTLKDIIELINSKKDFTSKYVNEYQKKYFLENFHSIEVFKGRTSEIAFIKKK